MEMIEHNFTVSRLLHERQRQLQTLELGRRQPAAE